MPSVATLLAPKAAFRASEVGGPTIVPYIMSMGQTFTVGKGGDIYHVSNFRGTTNPGKEDRSTASLGELLRGGTGLALFNSSRLGQANQDGGDESFGKHFGYRWANRFLNFSNMKRKMQRI